MIINRRMLLATLGLSLSAASAEAATRKKTPKKPASTHRVAQHKPRRPAAPKPASQG